MGNFLRTDFGLGWQPSADAFNAPKNALLRMDNLILDELGSLSLRHGTAKINSDAFADAQVHSLFTTTLNGSKVRLSGCTNAVYANGTSIASGLSGSGDIAFGSHMGQVLFARSTSKKKYDGTTVRNWGIAAPGAAPTLAVLPPDSKTFASCASSELPVMTSNEGSQAFATDRFGLANASVQISPDSTTGRGMSTKTFTVPQDFTVYNIGGIGTDSDLIDFYAYLTEPQYISGLTIMIDVNDGTFQSDWYEYTFAQGQVVDVVNTSEQSLASTYTVEGADRDALLARMDGDLQDGPPTYTINTIVGWNHYQIQRGAMTRRGLTPGKDWSTVMAVRVIVVATAGGSGAAVRFDDITIRGAGGFTGRYAARVVAAYDNGTYVALSGPSAISNEIDVVAQPLTVTMDATTVAALDSQVNQIWVYLMGGRMDAFYRVAVETLSTATGGTFDYTSPFEYDYFTSVEGIANYTAQFEAAYGGTIGPASHNHSWEEDYLGATDPITITITSTSDIEVLAANLRLETDNTTPPDSIIGIEGPHFDRTLCLTAQYVYPSRQLNPDSYSTGEVIRIGDATETGLWIKKLSDSTVYVGTTRDIYRFDGDWTVLPDGSINVVKRPLHVSEPPISPAVEVGNINGVETLIYLSGDGWHALNVGPLVNNAVDLLWRGFTRHGVEYVNITSSSARFRVAVAKNVMFAITPEGSDTTSSDVIHAYHFGRQRWYRFVYPQAFLSIHAEPDGTLIAGDASGFVRQLDYATKQDDGADIAVVMWTPVDDNGEPFTYKGPENLWMRVETGDDTATVAFHLNGNSTANSSTTTSQETTDTANVNVSTVSEFTQLQLRITGSFSSFIFRGWGLRYLDNPMPAVIHDTGYVDLSGDVTKWVRRLRIKAKSPVALTVQPYWDGEAATTRTITVEPGIATVYEVPLGRQDYGKVGRVVITSSSPSHIFWIEMQFNGTGKQNQKRISLLPEVA